MTPTKACTKDNEGESVYNPVNPLSIWVCKSLAWKPYEWVKSLCCWFGTSLLYRLVPSTGKTKELSANNCKEIKEALSTDCTLSPQSGVYWVQNQQVSSYIYRTEISSLVITKMHNTFIYSFIKYVHMQYAGVMCSYRLLVKNEYINILLREYPFSQLTMVIFSG